jgi:hypothetical protein
MYKCKERKQLCNTLKAMRWRCKDPNKFPYHAGRGITCTISSVQELYEEIGYRPSKEYTIDRIDNDGNYEKGNIRWAKRDTQTFNSRIRSDNKTGFPGVSWHKTNERWCSSHRGQYLYEGRSFGDALAHKLLAMEQEP